MEGIFIHFIKEHKRAPKNFWPIAITLRTPSEVELKHSTKFQIFSVAFSFCVPKVGTKQCAFFVVLFLHLLSFFFPSTENACIVFWVQATFLSFLSLPDG